MSAAVLSIGTEITRGEITNTNASWLAEQLTMIGHEVEHIEAVADDRARIAESLERLGRSHDVIVCTGGLGPTTDDITSECVAALLGVKLEEDSASLEAIRALMARFGRTVAESNRKQADFPEGATVLPNPNGTAPGFSVSIYRAKSFFLPGVPREMRPMFLASVAPSIHETARANLHQVRLKTFGAPESTVNDQLSGVEAQHDVTLGYRAHFPEIEVKVLARGLTPESARNKATRAADDVRQRLGDIVYGEGDTTLAMAVGSLCRERGLRLGTAESCTGGLVGALLTDAAGSSDFFAGAIVSYANEVKTSVLGVREATLREHGAVSEETVREMASGALGVLGVDLAIALTGIAGPGGGTTEKPVGLVYFAVATREGTSSRHRVFPGSRDQIRRIAAFAGLGLAREVLSTGHGK